MSIWKSTATSYALLTTIQGLDVQLESFNTHMHLKLDPTWAPAHVGSVGTMSRPGARASDGQPDSSPGQPWVPRCRGLHAPALACTRLASAPGTSILDIPWAGEGPGARHSTVNFQDLGPAIKPTCANTRLPPWKIDLQPVAAFHFPLPRPCDPSSFSSQQHQLLLFNLTNSTCAKFSF